MIENEILQYIVNWWQWANDQLISTLNWQRWKATDNTFKTNLIWYGVCGSGCGGKGHTNFVAFF